MRNPKISLTEMDKNDDLKNRVRVQMDQLNLIVVKKSSKEITSRESKPALEERRKHHNFVCIGCGNVFSSSVPPL
jgi:Fe2+ or Zn2+ uptake regulation protein